MSLISNLYKIQKKDLDKAVTVLDNAFSEDSMWKEVFDDEEKNRILTEVMVRFCLTYGNVVSKSNKLEGVMAIAPYSKDMNLLSIIRSGAFFLSMKLVMKVRNSRFLVMLLKRQRKVFI
jgi:hypothetical protein